MPIRWQYMIVGVHGTTIVRQIARNGWYCWGAAVGCGTTRQVEWCGWGGRVTAVRCCILRGDSMPVCTHSVARARGTCFIWKGPMA